MRQLQALLQPQSVSVSALSETVSQMSGVITKEIEEVNENISKMQSEFGRRIQMLEERSANTSPPRKTGRVGSPLGGQAVPLALARLGPSRRGPRSWSQLARRFLCGREWGGRSGLHPVRGVCRAMPTPPGDPCPGRTHGGGSRYCLRRFLAGGSRQPRQP